MCIAGGPVHEEARRKQLAACVAGNVDPAAWYDLPAVTRALYWKMANGEDGTIFYDRTPKP